MLFLFEQKKILSRMRDVNPSSLVSKKLLEYHRKTHMLYSGAFRRKPVNKQFVNWVVDYHNLLVKEMLKRGFQHRSPLKKI